MAVLTRFYVKSSVVIIVFTIFVCILSKMHVLVKALDYGKKCYHVNYNIRYHFRIINHCVYYTNLIPYILDYGFGKVDVKGQVGAAVCYDLIFVLF